MSSSEQVDKHLRKLDQELTKFKMELEADNAGITEILEQSKCHGKFQVFAKQQIISNAYNEVCDFYKYNVQIMILLCFALLWFSNLLACKKWMIRQVQAHHEMLAII